MASRVCIIGAGPSGMLTLCAYKRLAAKGTDVQVTCFEKQSAPGGLWNYTWRTGTDEFGEPVHGSMYRDLFSNGPKECIEFPDYTFVQHFGRPIPSYPPREVLDDYLRGYWKFCGVSDDDIQLEHCVRNVTYDADKAVFQVRVDDLRKGDTSEQEFDYLIVAVGHFSVPNAPDLPGIEKFPGRVLHSHDVRDSREFGKQRVLIVGGSYSGEDIAMQCVKFGATSVTVAYRTRAIAYKFPPSITQHSEVVAIKGKRVTFKDGHMGQFDSIILCTGYQLKFPFLPADLALKCGNMISPPNLYRMIQWTVDGDITKGKLLYLGMTDQVYTYTMFMLQSLWAASFTKGLVVIDKTLEEKQKEIVDSVNEGKSLTHTDHTWGLTLFQNDYLKLLCSDLGYTENIDTTVQFKEWLDAKYDNIMTYRDVGHISNFDKTGCKSPIHPVPWLKLTDDSMASYLKE